MLPKFTKKLLTIVLVTNLICFTKFISKVLDKHGQVDVICTDLSKAFDTIAQPLPLSKLKAFRFVSSDAILLQFKSLGVLFDTSFTFNSKIMYV